MGVQNGWVAQIFGRTALIEEGWEKWRAGERRFPAVVGAGGSGKSSLAQAGLLPRFVQDLHELGMAPEIVILRPGARWQAAGKRSPGYQRN
jgi:hypothetical protein